MNNKKKCRYCMSEIDVNAKICPNCRKRQKKGKFILIIVLFLFLLLIILPTIVGTISDSKLSMTKSKAEEYISRARIQIMDDLDKEYMCYSIDEDEYLGSVEVKYKDGKYSYRIWLSDGAYYASGDDNDISVVKSSKTATTNCHRY